MRCSALCLASLALFLFEAQGRDCAKDCKDGQADCLKACEQDEDQLTATDRELTPFNPTTAKPPFDVKKIIAPVVGGVIGAGALAGVIAVSVMKRPTDKPPTVVKPRTEVLQPHVFQQKVSVLTQAAGKGQNSAVVANQYGFHISDNVVIDQGLATQEENQIAGFGSLIFQHPLNFDHAAGSKIATLPGHQNLGANPLLRGAVTTAAPTDQSSLAGNSLYMALGCGAVICALLACGAVAMLMNPKKKRGKQPPRRDTIPEDQKPLTSEPAAESQYMPMGGMESQYMPVTPGIGQMPTLNAVPMQTMPPPTTMFAPNYGGYGASPLAMPTTAMPTAYNMGPGVMMY